jgi:peroxiredoxin (alkyl hydroperoxide reductase subunit C)
MSLLVGKPAPEFTTRAYYQGAFKDISLSDFKGKWVILMFYPGDFTFVCATEVAAAAEDHEAFESLGAATITISVDSPHVHKAWMEQELREMTQKPVAFPMASDGAGKVGTLYGVYDEEQQIDHRGCFIVDPDGNLQAVLINNPMVGRSFEEVFRLLTGLIHVRKNKMEALPCGWLPGDKVLVPSPEMVGHIHGVWNTSNMSIGKMKKEEGGSIWTSDRMRIQVDK